MATTAELQRVRSKIQALKSKTVANGCTPSEAESAKAKILELQLKYGIGRKKTADPNVPPKPKNPPRPPPPKRDESLDELIQKLMNEVRLEQAIRDMYRRELARIEARKPINILKKFFRNLVP